MKSCLNYKGVLLKKFMQNALQGHHSEQNDLIRKISCFDVVKKLDVLQLRIDDFHKTEEYSHYKDLRFSQKIEFLREYIGRSAGFYPCIEGLILKLIDLDSVKTFIQQITSQDLFKIIIDCSSLGILLEIF